MWGRSHKHIAMNGYITNAGGGHTSLVNLIH